MDHNGSSIRGYHPGDHIPGNRFIDGKVKYGRNNKNGL